ncbi:Glycosyltransferase involved in cell wall bisynthesis [Algoriphagus faecimaris]|uniref:Glycosyltransferase involved in cell wall bisynthesis n=1 Tax=Algoriphagus faecimaris TaxID=686796 RepID=A0A1G6M9E1_9BACT|nr:glycosyltransferase family 4 protein [Algoriphagus faecimaris]SDC52212.1 Glycosyltransferase involved in cell wall bisynthesis [Algoriphagus faecimaris]
MRKKLLYVTPSFQSFVKADLQLLKNHFQVCINHYPWEYKQYAPVYFLRQFFALIPLVFQTDLVIVNFGGYWAFWPTLFARLFGKKSVIIIHGTDSAAIPEINYGSLRIPILKKICGAAYLMTDRIFPVSESLLKTQLNFDPKILNKNQGIETIFPKISTPTEIIYNGLDEEFWDFPAEIAKEENSFLTVMSYSQFDLKGGDLILKLALALPECHFYFAGVDANDLSKKTPENVHFLGKLSPEKLRERYQKSQFYFQLSSFEGFGCALAEAMLCGCIPIGAKTNHIPQIIGEAGLILAKKDLQLALDLVQKALLLPNKKIWSKKARTQITQNFTLKMREEKLIKALKLL